MPHDGVKGGHVFAWAEHIKVAQGSHLTDAVPFVLGAHLAGRGMGHGPELMRDGGVYRPDPLAWRICSGVGPQEFFEGRGITASADDGVVVLRVHHPEDLLGDGREILSHCVRADGVMGGVVVASADAVRPDSKDVDGALDPCEIAIDVELLTVNAPVTPGRGLAAAGAFNHRVDPGCCDSMEVSEEAVARLRWRISQGRAWG